MTDEPKEVGYGEGVGSYFLTTDDIDAIKGARTTGHPYPEPVQGKSYPCLPMNRGRVGTNDFYTADLIIFLDQGEMWWKPNVSIPDDDRTSLNILTGHWIRGVADPLK